MNSPIASLGRQRALADARDRAVGHEIGDLALVERMLGAAVVDRAEIAIDHEADLGGRARRRDGDRRREHDVAVADVGRAIEVRARARERQQHVVGLPLGVVDEDRRRHEPAHERLEHVAAVAADHDELVDADRAQRIATPSARIGRPPTSTMHFGISSVCAPSRRPRPAAIRIAARSARSRRPRRHEAAEAQEDPEQRAREVERVDRGVRPEVDVDAVRRPRRSRCTAGSARRRAPPTRRVDREADRPAGRDLGRLAVLGRRLARRTRGGA